MISSLIKSHWLDPVTSSRTRSPDLNDRKSSFPPIPPQFQAHNLQRTSPQLLLLLLLLSICAPATADSLKGICAYSISGAYGPISRYLYYAFLVIPMVLHRLEWLVGGTLGASMLFSSITAIHGIALASVRGRGTADLDIIPVFAITGVGMAAGTPMMIWSKTLRQAARSARAIVFLWIGLMFIGVLASVASLKAVSRPQPCDATALLQGNCGLICNATLPMRNAQPVISIPYLWRDELFHYSGWFAFYGTVFAFMGIMYASSRQTPREMALQQLGNKGMSKRLREKNAGHMYCGAFCIPPLGIVLAFAHIVITELIMMGPHHVPLGEGLDAIGQWGTLVGGFFAILASIIKVWIDKKEAPSLIPGRKWPTASIDLEANVR
ncbi:MAG: hypothetical protein Q9195_003105 [Heterodermia aff. obscurata]